MIAPLPGLCTDPKCALSLLERAQVVAATTRRAHEFDPFDRTPGESAI